MSPRRRRPRARPTPRPVLLLCPAGFERVVAQVARAELADFEVRAIGSGSVRGTTRASARALQAYPCATNAFVVAAETARTTLDEELRALRSRLAGAAPPAEVPQGATFRLRLHDDGRFASTAAPAARALESAVAEWAGLRPARAGARHEFWVVRRSDHPDVVLGVKYTARNLDVPRGTLRPEVAAALARLEPVRGRAVVDPFAGSGAIGVACLDAGAGHVWLNDRTTRPRVPARFEGRFRVTRRDFRALDVEDGTVDAVVTDPPWGVFEEVEGGTVALYEDLAAAASRWLHPRGGLVVLTGAPAAAVARLLDVRRFETLGTVPVLINGRKSSVVHARRVAEPRR